MKKRRRLIIENGEDFKNKLNIAYDIWSKSNFNYEWYTSLDSRWYDCCAVDMFKKYLMLKIRVSNNEFIAQIEPEVLFLNSMDDNTKNIFLTISKKNKPHMKIENEECFKDKINDYYTEWKSFKYSKIYLECLKKSYDRFDDAVSIIIELLHKKIELSHDEYIELEEKKIKRYIHEREELNRLMDDFMKRRLAEMKAFEEAGIDEGTVEYTCPICGDIAVANRYKFNGRYHGLGSGCKTCGVSHS